MTEAATFTCSICGEPSTEICVYCTKDACPNHRCPRCGRCSDCCECDVPLDVEGESTAEAGAESTPMLAEPEASATPDLNTPRPEVLERTTESKQPDEGGWQP